MNHSLPTLDFMDWPWEKIEPQYRILLSQPLDAGSIESWLDAWSWLSAKLHERQWRLYIETTRNTADESAQQAYEHFLEEIYPKVEALEFEVQKKLLESGLQPAGFEEPLRRIQSQVSIFREENLPHLSAEKQLASRYDAISGAQTVEWEGEERTLSQLRPVLQEPDRDRRERAWRTIAARQLADREAINNLWVELFDLRSKIAANAGLENYRDYQWKQLNRFDYTPDDCSRFQDAIEQVVVPAAEMLVARRKEKMGLDRLRPWDFDADPLAKPPLKPFESSQEFSDRTLHIFRKLDPQLGEYFEIMYRENLLDLENRKNKAGGAYCFGLPATGRPFLFMNAVGIAGDVSTMLHESGHAFHFFEAEKLPYYHLKDAPMEFSEVASMGMERLASPYLTKESGGFFTRPEFARAMIEDLENSLLFWPYMAVVDAFQHWAYTNPEAARNHTACDEAWAGLWRRFMYWQDWSGLEVEMATGWQRKLHIFHSPFYYVEYGVAQLGAMQVWRNALQDQQQAVRNYRSALALGGSRPLPELFSAAGARFAMDAPILQDAVDLIEEQVKQLTPLAET